MRIRGHHSNKIQSRLQGQGRLSRHPGKNDPDQEAGRLSVLHGRDRGRLSPDPGDPCDPGQPVDPQEERGLAGRAPQRDLSFHANLGLLVNPGGDLVWHLGTKGSGGSQPALRAGSN